MKYPDFYSACFQNTIFLGRPVKTCYFFLFLISCHCIKRFYTYVHLTFFFNSAPQSKLPIHLFLL